MKIISQLVPRTLNKGQPTEELVEDIQRHINVEHYGHYTEPVSERQQSRNEFILDIVSSQPSVEDANTLLNFLRKVL